MGPGVSNVQVGDRCSVEPYLNCQGNASPAGAEKPNCCAELRVLGVHSDGGMRELICVPTRKLHASRTLTLDQLALVETLAIGCHAVERARVEAGEAVLVIGAGPIGLSVIQFAVEAGGRVIVLDVNAERLAFCRHHLGVQHTVDASAWGCTQRRSGGSTAATCPPLVFDATGSPGSMAGAYNFPAPGGRLVFVGLFQGDVSFNDPGFHRRELTLLASRNALPGDFTRIIHLIEAGRIDTSPWITHRAPLSGVVDEFPAWARPDSGVIKAMIEV